MGRALHKNGKKKTRNYLHIHLYHSLRWISDVGFNIHVPAKNLVLQLCELT